ncbi:endonuclease/exonuclease/phosphatase family protein [Alkalihalobacillus sp. BA299]|uniref:endonuclease/exonuclease/phosphatase family protein n=1 Tax=Alkalihalobacillus sp. BA299 TaxID=2815938 RepID=UPI001ADC901F|nr:endonuclease/exonuclease/phosphatase family protein [Alkalihalobacillus sp. BA299]
MTKKFILISLFTLILLCMIHTLHEKYKVKYTWTSSNNHLLGEKMITITSYNIRYGKGLDNRVDLNRTIDTLRSIDADIISLQEIERYSVRSKFTDQVKLIADELEMNAVFYPSISYPGIYYGNAILSRFPIESTERIPLINKREARSAILSKIQLSNTQSINVINTHLGLDQDERLKAIETIYHKLDQLKDPIILTGDLNSLPIKQEYKTWDPYLKKSNKGKPIQTYYSQDWQVDYIFHSKEFLVRETNVMKSDASDHYPVTAVLYLQNFYDEVPIILAQSHYQPSNY